MGDCYSVELRIKLRNSTAANMQSIMREWMREKERGIGLADGYTVSGVRWHLAHCRKSGIRPDSLSGICKILLAFNQGNCRYETTDDGFKVFRSGFNASYSWYDIMVEAFRTMSWALAEGSSLKIDRDEGIDTFEISVDEDGESEVWEKHRKWM